jgi:poly-gamma-glutamate synthesis protein (capsule biosynthesis protein)
MKFKPASLLSSAALILILSLGTPAAAQGTADAANAQARAKRSAEVYDSMTRMRSDPNPQSPFGKPQDQKEPTPASVADGFTLAAGGDLLGLRQPVAPGRDPAFQKVIALFRGADAGFANLEGNVFDIGSFHGRGGGPLHAASVAGQLRDLGLTLLQASNNHSFDYGTDGIVATIDALDTAKVVHAGTGRNLSDAARPGILVTPKGSVAMISATSTVQLGAAAQTGRNDQPGQPGVNPLRNNAVTLVNKGELDTMRAIAARGGLNYPADATQIMIKPNDADERTGETFRLSDRTGLTYDVTKGDRDALLASISAAKRTNDMVVFTIHAHETANGAQDHLVPGDSLAPADFLVSFYHDAIDAGADAVVATGLHSVQGIEVYKGRPIFYSLGSLFFELGKIWPSDWYDSIVTTTEYRGGKPYLVKLFPIALGEPLEGRPRERQGLPELATGADATRILQEVQRRSQRFGTKIRIENGVGIVLLSDGQGVG